MLCTHIDMPVCDDGNIEPQCQSGAVARWILLTDVEQTGGIKGIEGKQDRIRIVSIPCPRVQHPEHTIPQTVRRNSRGCCNSREMGAACRFQREPSLVQRELAKGIIGRCCSTRRGYGSSRPWHQRLRHRKWEWFALPGCHCLAGNGPCGPGRSGRSYRLCRQSRPGLRALPAGMAVTPALPNPDRYPQYLICPR